MGVLAIMGGTPVVTQPQPHADRARFTEADRAAVLAYLADPANPNSFYGRDGLLRTYEEELAAFFGRRYCVLTNSGTSALFTAFFAAGLEPGDEVICPTYTFHATVMPLFQLGAVPVLAEAELDTGNIDPADVENKITDRTRAVVCTHQWGHPVNGSALKEIACRRGLLLIEDVSLAVGAELTGVRAGAFGEIACFSLGSTKLLSGGQGGALVTDDTTLWERSNLVGHFAHRSYQTVESPLLRQFAGTGLGHNFRMHVLAVAVSRARFHRLGELIDARRRRHERLSSLLARTGVFEPPTTRPGATRGSWHGYCARYRADRTGVPLDTVVKALAAEGLEVYGRGYHPPLHEQRIFQVRENPIHLRRHPPNFRTYRREDFPQTEQHIAQLVGFPLFLDEDLKLVEDYAQACQKVVDHLDELSASRAQNP